ncbi:alanyl-tRNA editing protein [Candidatus Merdisoma sp. HCP28S3_D10]|uniref:alanyl-tRNA editing protein n=1 Tax=unclassified Candidatus Merdisoma TaxID=3099611 RepID=UPI003F8A1D02
MTDRLYYKDSHLTEFPAVVTACEQEKDYWKVALDQTAFFPEGGGQAGDTGYLGDVEVFDTHEKNGEIWHYTRRPLEIGAEVKGVLDWKKRFSRMQQHSGEHIVSGLIHTRFGYDNVGFHLGEEEVTMDFNGPISREELAEIEAAANQVVFDNVPILISYPCKEELAILDYRSKIEIEGQVRIVTIPDTDVCACCAPHVERTGEIGLIKLTNVQSHRGGVRVSLLAGDRALRDYREKETSVKAVSVLLSAKEAVVADAVERLKQENFRLTGQLMTLNRTLIQIKASQVPEGQKSPVFFEESLDPDTSREFVNLLTARCGGIACVFTGNDETGYRYIFGSKTEDTRPLCKALNGQFGGKGGGKPEMVQGSLSGTQEEIMAAIETVLQR